MELNDVINKTYEVTDEIINSSTFKKLISLKEVIAVELKDLIRDFKNQETLYHRYKNDVSKYYEAKKAQIALQKLKIALYSHELVVEYKKLEKDVQGYLDTIKDKIIKNIFTKKGNEEHDYEKSDDSLS